MAFAATAAQAAQVEAPSDSLQVWNLNAHDMETGGAGETTDYRQFMNYITDSTRVAYYPDIITLQEVGNVQTKSLPSCHEIEFYLEGRTPLNYYCVETGKGGGTSILYNTNRLSRQTDTGTAVEVYRIVQSGTNAGGCAYSGVWYADKLRLKDDVNGKFVNAESVHLPTDNYPATDLTGWAPDCAMPNMRITNPAVTGLGTASMQIMAGDWNHSDANASNNYTTFNAWECWYQGMNTPDMAGCGGDAWDWKDAMYRQCVTTTTAVWSCLRNNHWTIGSSGARIDFLWVKAYAVHNQVTVPYSSAWQASGSPAGPQQYSDHRGQGSLVKYY